ncbi:hypothetical protein VMT40_16640 [Nocardia sp. CDC160]|nr:hypothetical protein [Nocardia sp. CDC160]
MAVGLAMLIAAFFYLNKMPGWADRYGAIWIYLGFFAYMSIAGRLFWKGADGIIERLRAPRTTSTPR